MLVQAGKRYKHRKTRGTYRVLCTAELEADLTHMVVYVSEKNHRAWVRPLAEFIDGRFLEIEET